ncbi:MAG TPA: hypothetical protein VG318_04255 [Actinomycetota bacterium]|nr:hypothetical protein [Actinomycetota bacterium]
MEGNGVARGRGGEILKVVVFALAVIGAIGAVVAAGFTLLVLFVAGTGQWG